ncbi:MAG: ABC transporter ATP-binding protein [Acetobacteraceae bacterium]
MAEAALLEVQGLASGYGVLQILWDISLEVRPDESVLLLGANGAGKTTLLRTIVGLIRAWEGTIRFRGQDITHLTPDARIRRGIAFMSELGVFPGLSIKENLRMGGYFLNNAEVRRRAEPLYALFPDLAKRKREPAASLSGGQRKMLGLAKALMAEPALLIMDEPSAGLAPVFVKEMVKTLGGMHGKGMALLIAEQNVSFLPLAERGYLLEGGRVRFSGDTKSLRESGAVRAAYLGV